MGYTHYWDQTKTYSDDEWTDIVHDIHAIVGLARNIGIRLGDAMGDDVTKGPEFDVERIAFNGILDDSHETFAITKKIGAWDFCKTEHKPYDVVVTACLCYMSSIAGGMRVSSDGHAQDFTAGLQLARAALPNLANQLDYPMGVMEDDRWTYGGISMTNRSEKYNMRFCVNGKAYIMRNSDMFSYVFPSHEAGKLFVEKYREIISPTGSFDSVRWKKIQSAQTRLFKKMVEAAELFPEFAGTPMPYVRPY